MGVRWGTEALAVALGQQRTALGHNSPHRCPRALLQTPQSNVPGRHLAEPEAALARSAEAPRALLSPAETKGAPSRPGPGEMTSQAQPLGPR